MVQYLPRLIDLVIFNTNRSAKHIPADLKSFLITVCPRAFTSFEIVRSRLADIVYSLQALSNRTVNAIRLWCLLGKRGTHLISVRISYSSIRDNTKRFSLGHCNSIPRAINANSMCNIQSTISRNLHFCNLKNKSRLCFPYTPQYQPLSLPLQEFWWNNLITTFSDPSIADSSYFPWKLSKQHKSN